jgi:hypothetical protein
MLCILKGIGHAISLMVQSTRKNKRRKQKMEIDVYEVLSGIAALIYIYDRINAHIRRIAREEAEKNAHRPPTKQTDGQSSDNKESEH